MFNTDESSLYIQEGNIETSEDPFNKPAPDRTTSHVGRGSSQSNTWCHK